MLKSLFCFENLEPPGSRLPLHLASVTHALTLQHVVDRVNLICAQQNLNMPTRTASSLVLLATQVSLLRTLTSFCCANWLPITGAPQATRNTSYRTLVLLPCHNIYHSILAHPLHYLPPPIYLLDPPHSISSPPTK
jgi:hypothetical protein